MKSEHEFTQKEINFNEQYNKLVKTKTCKEINMRVWVTKRTSHYETKADINEARTDGHAK